MLIKSEWNCGIRKSENHFMTSKKTKTNVLVMVIGKKAVSGCNQLFFWTVQAAMAVGFKIVVL